MKRFLRNIAIALAILLACGNVSAGNVSVKASLDSVAVIMGQKTVLRYEIVQDKDHVGHMVMGAPDVDNVIALTDKVEATEGKCDTTDLGNNRIQIDRSLIVQAFDSGVWEIPAALYVIGRDTFRSNALNLKVIPVPVDTLKTVHPYKPVADVPFHIVDYIPDFIVEYWWIFLTIGIIAVLLTLLIILYKRYRAGIPLIAHKVPEIPPYEEAIQALNAIKESHIWENGNDKEYYTRLTDVLRRYIFRRFAIYAVEMTSSEIISALKANEETREVHELIKAVFDIADLVKFAKVRPLPDDNVASLRRAMSFVEQTKPAEPQPEEDAPGETTPENTPTVQK